MKYKHRACPCGCGEMADECMNPTSPLQAFRLTGPDAVCECCGRSQPRPNAPVSGGGLMHFDCWDDHHSDPTGAWPPAHRCVSARDVGSDD